MAISKSAQDGAAWAGFESAAVQASSRNSFMRPPFSTNTIRLNVRQATIAHSMARMGRQGFPNYSLGRSADAD